MTESSNRSDPTDPAAFHFYGRRRGHKLRAERRRLVETLLPRLRVDPSQAGGAECPAALFAPPVDDVWLEIGFGAGEHLAAQAAAHPEVGFIGCEPFVNGVAALLKQIDAARLKNIRIHDEDARPLLSALPDASIGRIFILFPDPWPKTRHHRRRLISPDVVAELARIAADHAELRFASDHGGYVAWALEHLTRHPEFSWTARCAGDWRQPPSDWVETRYERKARDQGAHPAYLSFRRAGRRNEG